MMTKSGAGANKYIKKETLKLLDDLVIPYMENAELKVIGYSDAIHKAVVEYANKRSLLR